MSGFAFALAPFESPPDWRAAGVQPCHSPAPRDAIDALKALASQLIVLHHLVLYGPLREALERLAPDAVGWLRQDGRLAVQAFLVLGGYLAAGAIWRAHQQGQGWASQVAGRWWRLVRPYAVALVLAMLAALAARALVADADTPAAPTLAQVAAHLLMLHDVLGVPALSAGVWYVAIDLQLFALWAAGVSLTVRGPRLPPVLGLLLLAGLAASWLGFNLDADGDAYAPYFFGSWGLGAAVWWLRARGLRSMAARGVLAGALVLLALALAMLWRERLVLAAAVAALLLVSPARWPLPAWLRAVVQRLAAMSYGVFLMHYPVLLLVGALAAAAGLNAPLAAGVMAALGWLASLAAGAALHHGVERRAWSLKTAVDRLRPQAKAMPTASGAPMRG